LVADDDQFSREMVRRALEADGHSVMSVEDGSDALAACEVGPAFDLVVTDVQMPNLDGIALVQSLIAMNADQRVIIMSGLADELSQARALLSPTVRMIAKPVTLEKIRGEVAELLA
jgi:CheY-like chemotaxis protein